MKRNRVYFAGFISLLLLIGIMGSLQKYHISIPLIEEKELKIPYTTQRTGPIIANHSVINWIRTDQIPISAINDSKNLLRIAYEHTSHGSQIPTGMNGLPAFKAQNASLEGVYDWNDGEYINGSLNMDDGFTNEDGDLGNPDFTTWESRTRTYLDNTANSEVNVVMWSWCGQVSWADETNINTYLSLMNGLETSYSNVIFVYMTGHTDGSGLTGNLHLRNNQIRDYCIQNNKVLFDFENIESYNPDGDYFGDKNVTDECYYLDGATERNWAFEWQNATKVDEDWYDCEPAHTRAVNGNMKAYAAWWLWARLAGWTPEGEPYNPPPIGDPDPDPTGFQIPGYPLEFLLGISIIGYYYIIKKKKIV